MLDLSSQSLEFLNQLYSDIAKSNDVARVVYNLIFSKNEVNSIPYQRELLLDRIENIILKQIQEMRFVKDDMDSMIIRKTDAINRRR